MKHWARPVIRAGVVGCVTVGLISGGSRLMGVLGVYDLRADTNSALTYEQRLHTEPNWSPGAGRVLEDARLWMPGDARYRVIVAPGFDAARTHDFSRELLLWYLLPRRPSESTSTDWVFCYGCDEDTLGDRFHVLARADGGPWFGRMGP